MTVEFRDKSWFLGKAVATRSFPGQDRTLGEASIHVCTPNLVTANTGSEVFYERDNINTIDPVGHGFGGESSIRWYPSDPSEDVGYQALETELLRHPLVGHEMALYFGTSERGIRQDLIEQGSRVETENRSRRRKGFVTTDAAWTKVEVIDGRRRNIYPNTANRSVPVKVRVVDGKYQGTETEVRDDQLRIVTDEEGKAQLDKIRQRTRKDLSVLSTHDRQSLASYGCSDNLIMWFILYGAVLNNSYYGENVVPAESVNGIIAAAAAQGIDVSPQSTIDIAVSSGVDLTNPDLSSGDGISTSPDFGISDSGSGGYDSGGYGGGSDSGGFGGGSDGGGGGL